jgi:long-chain acyl-CoA synthetase
MSTPYDDRPWSRFYQAGVPRDVAVPDIALTQLLDDAAAAFPRRKALAFLGRTISYRRLVLASDRFAGALRSLGVHKGDRVNAFYGTV